MSPPRVALLHAPQPNGEYSHAANESCHPNQLLNALAVTCWPGATSIARGKSAAREYLVSFIIGCFLVQLLARGALDRLSDQRLAATLFGRVTCVLTLLQWAGQLHVSRSAGFAGWDDDATTLVLVISTMFVQGLVVTQANGYCAARCVVLGFTYVAFATLVVHQHVPSGPHLLLTEAEFLGVFCFIVIGLHALAISQVQCACKGCRPRMQRSAPPNDRIALGSPLLLHYHCTHGSAHPPPMVAIRSLLPTLTVSLCGPARVASTLRSLQGWRSSWRSSATAFLLRWPLRRSER